jgi:hypothetical protein
MSWMFHPDVIGSYGDVNQHTAPAFSVRDVENHRLLHEILHVLRRIERTLNHPVRLTFHFEGNPDSHEGDSAMAQPISKLVGSTVNCSVPVETNAEGGNVPIVVANIAWSSDNAAVSGPITTNPDGSASFVGQSAGVCNITCRDNAFNLSDAGAATFTTDVTPTALTFSFS